MGVPALVANHVGPWGPERWVGIVGALMNPSQFRFLGQTNVADSDGTVRAQLGGGWLFAGASGDAPRDVLIGIGAYIGRIAYDFNAERRRRAWAAGTRATKPDVLSRSL